MNNSEAIIAITQEIPVFLTVVDQNGNQIPGATVSNVTWTMDNQIGTLTPDPKTPGKALFVAAKPGVTHITASAQVTIS